MMVPGKWARQAVHTTQLGWIVAYMFRTSQGALASVTATSAGVRSELFVLHSQADVETLQELLVRARQQYAHLAANPLAEPLDESITDKLLEAARAFANFTERTPKDGKLQ